MDCDILLNVNPISGYEENLDIELNITNNSTDGESDCLITLDINYDLYDYPYCNNCDILMDIIPEGMFNSTFVQTDYNGDTILDPETNEPLIEAPAEEEFLSCFGVRAYFQLPDCGNAIEIPYTDIMNLNIKTGINQPTYWSFDLINKDRKYSDPNGDYHDLFTENLYVPNWSSRRFIAIVLMSFCGEKTETLVFPRLVIKEISGTEIISLSGIDEISEYLSRNVTLESYCCQEALSKVIPEGQEEIDPDLVVSNQYVAVALTNAFVSNGIDNNDTQLLLNYNYDLPFEFDSYNYTFTVEKPNPQPLIYGEFPGETPIYQIQDVNPSDVHLFYNNSKYNLVEINNVIAAQVPVLDINGQYIRDSYNNIVYQYYIVDPRLPVIAISPLSMQWTINDMCKKIIDNQDGDIKKEYFQVNQHYQDFKIYSDINIQNTSVGEVLNNCLSAIPSEYIIGSTNKPNVPESFIQTDFPEVLYMIDCVDTHPTYTYNISTYSYNNSLEIGYTTTTTTETKTGIVDWLPAEDPNYGKTWIYYVTYNITTYNYHIDISGEISVSNINNWKLKLDIYNIILDSEKPSSPNWYIPEVLLRSSEHNINRTGVDKFNTINVISPLELGTAQVYSTVIEVPPSDNQYVRPIFSLNTGEFLGFSGQFPTTTKSDSYYYTSSVLSIAYKPYYYGSVMTVNFGNNNTCVISPSSSSPSTHNIYDFSRSSFYVLTILWNNPVRQ